MLASKTKAVKGLTSGIEFLLKKNKTDYVKGTGSIISPNKVKVVGLDGKIQTLESKNIVIATGSEASSFPGIIVDEESIVTSTGALSLKKIPESMVKLIFLYGIDQ